MAEKDGTMKSDFRTLFCEHPASVGESYTEHFAVAAGYSARLFAAGAAAMMHAFFPFLFKQTASRAIKQMHDEMAARKGGSRPLGSAELQSH